VFSTVKELTMDMTTQIPALAQRGRAAINFQAGIGIAASRLLRQSEQAFQSSAAAAAPLPADMDERHAVVAGVIGDLPAFKVQSLLSEWRGRAHGAVAREAFEEVQDRIAPALHGLDSGPSTLHADPAFVAPAYWSETEFHRTAGGWDSSDYNGYIHGELLHRLMLAKMFPGDIFAQRRAVAQAAPRRDYARILDMGASSGHFTIALADIFPEARITGIDLSPRMLEHAMRTGNARGAAWHLAVAAAEDTGLPAESFDLVASYNLFHELTPPVIEAVMDEAFRLLAPGGHDRCAALCRIAAAGRLALRPDRQMGRRAVLARLGLDGPGGGGAPGRLRRCAGRPARPAADRPPVQGFGPEARLMDTHERFAVRGDSAARRILSPDQLDHLGEAILALTGEVWVLTDRMMVLEQVLSDAGTDVTAAIETFTPSAAFEARLDARRDKLIGAVVAALTGATR
jgi:SAM-dependent methyltransferase